MSANPQLKVRGPLSGIRNPPESTQPSSNASKPLTSVRSPLISLSCRIDYKEGSTKYNLSRPMWDLCSSASLSSVRLFTPIFSQSTQRHLSRAKSHLPIRATRVVPSMINNAIPQPYHYTTGAVSRYDFSRTEGPRTRQR